MPTGIPHSVQDALDRFCGSARAALGDRLESIILFGSLARGEWVPNHSDINVMIVLKGVSLEALDSLVGPVHVALGEMKLSVMIATEPELRDSSDVFPVKFFDIRRHRRVLWGRDVLADLPISRDHLRLRCEQELRNLALRLRRFYVLRAHRPEQLRVTLESGLSSLLSGLGVMLHLRGGDVPATRTAVAEASARAFQLDGKAIQDVLDLKSGGSAPEPAELRRRYGAFLSVATRAAEAVDKL